MSKRIAPEQLDPPGFLRQFTEPAAAAGADAGSGRQRGGFDPAPYEKRAMEIAKGQGAGLFQVMLMLYMFIGNQLNLWSIFFLLAMGTAPIRNVLNVEAAFQQVAVPGVNLMVPKTLYLLINMVGVACFAWKLRAMGLLPVTSADWVSLLPSTTPVEFSAVASPVGA